MWFKNGLKAQKLLAQGSALGYYDRKTCRPVRAKAFKYQACNKAFALTGRRAKCCLYPGRCPGRALKKVPNFKLHSLFLNFNSCPRSISSFKSGILFWTGI